MYQLIYADPPWQYSNKISNGAADDHYSTMRLEEIKRLPVWSIAAENAVLAMWYTGNFAAEAVELAQAWGFKVKTMKGFTWVKLYEQSRGRIERALADQTMLDFEDFLDALSAETVMNGGNYTRGNSEDVLIAIRGAGLERVSASVKQVVHSCRGEHSEKPAEVRFRLEELYGSITRIELFSRGDAPGWHQWGNENPFNDVELVPATFTTIPPERNSRVKVLAGHYLAVPADAVRQNQPQNIPEMLPTSENGIEPGKESPEIIEKVMGETEIPLTKELLIAKSGVQVWACAAAAFGDKVAFTFNESKYAHAWAADSIERPEFVVVPAETIAKAVSLIRSSSEADAIGNWVKSSFSDHAACPEISQRLNTVASEFNKETGLSTAGFISLLEKIDRECCMNIRVLRSRIREVITVSGAAHYDT